MSRSMGSRSPNISKQHVHEEDHDIRLQSWQMPKAGHSLYNKDFIAKPAAYVSGSAKLDKELGLMFGYKPRPPTPPKWEKASDYQYNFRPPQNSGKHELTFRNFSRAEEDNFGAALAAPSLQMTSTHMDDHRSPPRHAKASSTCKPSDAIGFPQGRATDYWLSQQRRDVEPARLKAALSKPLARSTSAPAVDVAAMPPTAQAESVLSVQEPDGWRASEVSKCRPAASTLSAMRPDAESVLTIQECEGSALAPSPPMPRRSPKASVLSPAPSPVQSRQFRPLPEIRAPFSSPLRAAPFGSRQHMPLV